MDRVIIYETKQNTKSRLYLCGYNSYRDIKEGLKTHSIHKIVNVKKFKLCPCCNDGDLEVEDKRGMKLLTEK